MRLLRPVAAVCAAAILLGLVPQAASSAPAAVTVAVRPAAAGVHLLVSASAPFRFALRQLQGPDRLVVDLLGLEASVPAGVQEVNLTPVRTVRLARGSGFVQVVIDLTGPVLAGVSGGADGRSLTLSLQVLLPGLAARPEVPSPAAPASQIVRARTADPEALARALQQAVPGLTVTPDRALGALILQGSRADVERAMAILAALDAQPAPAAPQMRVEVIPLKHAMPSEFLTEPATSRSAEDMAQTVQAALQPIHPELRITVEKRLQALILTGTPGALAAARGLVERLDQPSPQVALEVRVVEVAANALANLGVSLSPIVGTTLTETDPTNRPFTFGRTPLNITLILNLLVERGQAKILASPTIATIDGRKALIRTGDEIPLVTRQIYSGVVIENVITFRAGVTLEIIPKLSPEGTITVILRPVVSTITGMTPQGAPQISTREVQTTLAVRDGETIVIGGLLEERDIVSMSRIPGLGDLPFFGRLFRSERREQRRTELVVTVTPRVLPPPQPASPVQPAPSAQTVPPGHATPTPPP